jgi:hypothetical protein
MADRVLDAIDHALLAALREIAARRLAEKAERRAKIRLVDGAKRGGQAA